MCNRYDVMNTMWRENDIGMTMMCNRYDIMNTMWRENGRERWGDGEGAEVCFRSVLAYGIHRNRCDLFFDGESSGVWILMSWQQHTGISGWCLEGWNICGNFSCRIVYPHLIDGCSRNPLYYYCLLVIYFDVWPFCLYYYCNWLFIPMFKRSLFQPELPEGQPGRWAGLLPPGRCPGPVHVRPGDAALPRQAARLWLAAGGGAGVGAAEAPAAGESGGQTRAHLQRGQQAQAGAGRRHARGPTPPAAGEQSCWVMQGEFSTFLGFFLCFRLWY